VRDITSRAGWIRRNARTVNRNQDRRERRLALLGVAVAAAAPSLMALSQAFGATPLYWDINNATSGGSGNTLAAGTWNTTNNNWSTDPAGAVATTNWLSGGGTVAVFSAGTNVSGAFTVTVG
jgi:hypothetical protein